MSKLSPYTGISNTLSYHLSVVTKEGTVKLKVYD